MRWPSGSGGSSGAGPDRGRILARGESARVTSALLWRATLIAAVIDVPLLLLIARAVSAATFRRLKWYLATATFLVYGLLWGAFGAVLFWNEVYAYVFPGWMRWPLPLAYGTLFGAIALLFWRLAQAAPRRAALCFCLLGGLVSLAGHGIGIQRGLLRTPLLSEASAASALVFGVFEFIAYWCVIVGIAVALRAAFGRSSHEAAAGT